jgi:sialic acid synthase SpsE
MKSTYIIGEIGQNHNGSVGMAKALIDLSCLEVRDEAFDSSLQGLNAVKLTKRDMSCELATSALHARYSGPNSFGDTYGQHRSHLELSDLEHFELYKYARSKSLDFVETLCSPSCLSILDYFVPDYLKVASRDLTNIPLLSALAETKIPIILSTGMAGENELAGAVSEIQQHHSAISILHCVSQYPTRPENVNLNTITWLKREYPMYSIGYSDHTIGISSAVAAVALGAEVIEKHITLDRRLRGTDQAGSLSPDGLRRMVRDIRVTERGLGEVSINIEGDVLDAQLKLERSIATTRVLPVGHVVVRSDLQMLSPGNGIRWKDVKSVLGKVVAREVLANELLRKKDLE